MFTMVFRWTLSTFYRVTLKYLYYACHYCILCDPFDSRLGNESLARGVGNCFVPFHIRNLTSGLSANMSPKYGQNRLSCGQTDIGIFFVYCYRLCGINVKNRSVKLTFPFNLLKKICLGFHSVATRFPFISGVLGRHNLRVSDSQNEHGFVRLLWYLETVLLLRQDCGRFLSSM